MELTQEQQRVLKLAKDGHNLVFTGQCGTGKTHLLRCIINEIATKCKVGVTSTTGMASMHLGYDSTTIHNWAGIVDGRFTNEKLAEIFSSDDRYQDAKTRISEAQVLVIDEIGMVSAKIFNMVEFVCRHVRGSKIVFGGLQVIACGDFKQLPPVPNYNLQDDGSYCFESTIFQATFPHHLNLRQVVRQIEPLLIKTVNELCDGCPSDGTIDLLFSLDRPIGEEATDVKQLYGTNCDASFVNQNILDEMENEQHVFKAEDSGQLHLLKKNIVAPKILCLKEGAPVMLTRNIGHGHYNGMCGTVKKLCACDTFRWVPDNHSKSGL